MNDDPVIQEVRAIRDAIAEETGHDVSSLFKMYRELSEKSLSERVSLPPRRVPRPTTQDEDPFSTEAA